MEKAELSWAEVKEMFAETDRQRAAAAVDFDRQMAARAADFDRKLAASAADFDRRMAETDRLIAENNKKFAELRVDIENTNKNINGISDSNGMFAQEYFFNALEKKLVFAGVHFDYADDTLGGRRKKRGCPTVQDQFDIVLINEEAVAVIEVKHRARIKDVDTLIDRKLKNFKYLYTSTYGNHKVYLGVAAMIFEDGVAEAAKEHGVGLLRQIGEAVEEEGAWEVRAY